jgi:hypothetical protein
VGKKGLNNSETDLLLSETECPFLYPQRYVYIYIYIHEYTDKHAQTYEYLVLSEALIFVLLNPTHFHVFRLRQECGRKDYYSQIWKDRLLPVGT